MLAYRLARTVSEFRRLAGEPGTYPLEIIAWVEWALPIVVYPVPALGERSARRWLAKKGLPAGDLDTGGEVIQGGRRAASRGLHGCLIAFAGRGFILYEANDPPEEARFSIAHEAAHFMLDYMLPRERARALSPAAVDLVDGVRQPTAPERLAAAISEVDLGPRAWLFARDSGGRGLCSATGEAEQDADRVAFELLAPEADVVLLADEPGCADGHAVARLVTAQFGLPLYAAERYVRQLIGDGVISTHGDDWLGAMRGVR